MSVSTRTYVDELMAQRAGNPCKCSGDGIGDLATLEMVDKLHIPEDLPAGEWGKPMTLLIRPPAPPRPCALRQSPRATVTHAHAYLCAATGRLADSLAGWVAVCSVLGWRWDCEESTQVWSSCSDVTIQKNESRH